MSASCCDLIVGEPCRFTFSPCTGNRRNRHAFYEPCLVVSGEGRFAHGSRTYTVKPGDLFLADAGVFHEISSTETTAMRLYYTAFTISESRSDEIGSALRDKMIREFLRGHQNHLCGQSHLASAFQEALTLATKRDLPHQAYFLEQIMQTLALRIISLLSTSVDDFPSSPDACRTLDKALQVIDAHLREPISVPEIAEKAGVSERSLRRIFRERLGSTVSREIQQRRIQQATVLLAMPQLSVAEIGQEVGIDDPSQFHRLFKKHMKVTPKEFRLNRLPAETDDFVHAVAIRGIRFRTEYETAKKTVD